MSKYYSLETGKVGSYKFYRTSQFNGAITIYIKKRLFGFLNWVLVKDDNGMPVSFNKQEHAEAFMNHVVKYDDVLDSEFVMVDDKVKEIVHPMTDNAAANKICKLIFEKTGETVPFDCALGAWILEGKQFIHRAVDYAQVWNEIYKFKGKKSWEIMLNH